MRKDELDVRAAQDGAREQQARDRARGIDRKLDHPVLDHRQQQRQGDNRDVAAADQRQPPEDTQLFSPDPPRKQDEVD